MFEAFGRKVYDVGEFGNGSKMKYVANLLVAVHNVASAEAMVLGMKAGLDPRMIFDLIQAGAGNSRVFELRAPMMVKGNYKDATMKIDVWDKDMSVIGGYARKIKVPTPLFDATKPVYVKAQKSGYGAQDTAAVCAVLEKMGKVKRRQGQVEALRVRAPLSPLAGRGQEREPQARQKKSGRKTPWPRSKNAPKSATACASTSTCRSPWTTAWSCAPTSTAR